jgi:hypothetical protein
MIAYLLCSKINCFVFCMPHWRGHARASAALRLQIGLALAAQEVRIINLEENVYIEARLYKLTLGNSYSQPYGSS